MEKQITFQYLGDSGFHLLLENGYTVLVNPPLTALAQPGQASRDLAADMILLTHGETGIFGNCVEIARSTDAVVVANEQICAYLNRTEPGIATESLSIGGELLTAWGSVVMVMSAHSSILPDNTPGGLACGFVIKTSGHRIYHSGNSGLFGELRFIGEYYKPNVALLPVADRFKLGSSDIGRVLAWLGSDIMIPMYSVPENELAAEELHNTLDTISFTVDHETPAIFKRLAPGESWELARAESSGRSSGPESRY